VVREGGKGEGRSGIQKRERTKTQEDWGIWFDDRSNQILKEV